MSCPPKVKPAPTPMHQNALSAGGPRWRWGAYDAHPDLLVVVVGRIRDTLLPHPHVPSALTLSAS